MLENKYQVTKDADRMGMRLSGEVIKPPLEFETPQSWPS